MRFQHTDIENDISDKILKFARLGSVWVSLQLDAVDGLVFTSEGLLLPLLGVLVRVINVLVPVILVVHDPLLPVPEVAVQLAE